MISVKIMCEINRRRVNIFPRIYIVILNWNGWKDSIECLEHLAVLNYPNFKIVLCDNDSQDDSMAHILKWAETSLEFNDVAESGEAYSLMDSNQETLNYIYLTQEEALEFKNAEKINSKYTFIKNSENLGFAHGTNIGIKYSLLDMACDYIWVLNNDTAPNKDSLSELVARIHSDDRIGVCGSTLLYYHKPKLIQALGGDTYNPWIAYCEHLGGLNIYNPNSDYSYVENKIDFVVGASMLVKRNYLEEVGLLCEDYFLYFEELDWVIRGKKKGFKIGFAPKSIVYHKEGSSTGASNADINNKSKISDFYLIRNKLLVTRKFFPYALPVVYFTLIITILKRLKRRQWDRILMIIKIILFNDAKIDH